jgi:hypothetical protein
MSATINRRRHFVKNEMASFLLFKVFSLPLHTQQVLYGRDQNGNRVGIPDSPAAVIGIVAMHRVTDHEDWEDASLKP